MREKYIIANWKMNKTMEEADKFLTLISCLDRNKKVNLVICAAYTSIIEVQKKSKEMQILVGAQNVSQYKGGAYTGEISVDMLKELGVTMCIVGHSDRRDKFFESDLVINEKVKALLEEHITPIICVGEHIEERKNSTYKDKIEFQIRKALEGVDVRDIKRCMIAYEPIWAISTNTDGVILTKDDAEEMCSYIRYIIAKIYGVNTAEEVVILYGGSVNKENAKEYLSLPSIDGALVGGASLKVDLIDVVNAYER